MKRSLISLCCLLVTYLLFSQDNSKEYLDLIEKGRSLIRAKDYKNAAITFSSAISLASDKDPIFAHHRAAFSWALANYPDSAFYHLNFIANLKDLSFKDVDDIISNSLFNICEN